MGGWPKDHAQGSFHFTTEDDTHDGGSLFLLSLSAVGKVPGRSDVKVKASACRIFPAQSRRLLLRKREGNSHFNLRHTRYPPYKQDGVPQSLSPSLLQIHTAYAPGLVPPAGHPSWTCLRLSRMPVDHPCSRNGGLCSQSPSSPAHHTPNSICPPREESARP